MSENCIFCKIISGKLPSKTEYEDEDLIVIHDINPIAPVHVLIIPKEHIVNLNHISKKHEKVLGKIIYTASIIAKKLKIDDGFRVLNANEKKAGQSVFHMHFHLIGGWREDQAI